MRAKIKISVLATGQEFLLLVAKMNLKGVLVFSPQIIPTNSELLLELKLAKENPILLKGFVHKVSDDDSSKKGMVIAFLNPSAETKASIEKFIGLSQGSNAEQDAAPAKKKSRPKKKRHDSHPCKKEITVAENERSSDLIQPEKTVIVDNTLPALSLQSPDNKLEMQVSTRDEENVHHAGNGLAGETRHVQIHETLTRRNQPQKPFVTKLYRTFGVVLIIVGLILFFRHGVGWIEQQFNIKLMPTRAATVNNSNLLPSVTPQVPEEAHTSTTGSIDTISIDDQGDFLKVTFLGDGNYANYQVEKLKSPYRIVFTFNTITKLNQTFPMQVNKSPIAKIDATIESGNVVLTMFMMEKSFLEFDAKPFPNAMDVFFYRE
ncbi:MAG: hypothetical protein R3A45_01245 [Bdellovibrionota bacterium]